MGNLSLDMQTEVGKDSPELYIVADLEFASGTKRYAEVDLRVTDKFYDGRVKPGGWGVIEFIASDCRGGLQLPTTHVTIFDYDYEFSKLVDKDGIKALSGTTAKIRMVSPNVSDADSFTIFTGIFEDAEKLADALEWKIKLRMDDRALRRDFPKHTPTLFDFPNSDADSLKEPTPLITGVHDAESLTTGGMVPTLFVDSSLNRYMVAAAYVKVDEVFKDGVEQTTGWSEVHTQIGGREYTFVDFTSSQGTSVITVNVTGYDTNADGTGTVIKNPADALKHYLVNFIYNDYKSGSWFADSAAPIDTTHFTEMANFFTTIGGESSRRIGGKKREGRTMLEEWLSNHAPARAFWTHDGKLAVRPDSPFTTAIYLDEQWYSWERGPDEGFRFDFSAVQLLGLIDISYIYGEAPGTFFATLQVSDPSVNQNLSTSLESFWSASRAV